MKAPKLKRERAIEALMAILVPEDSGLGRIYRDYLDDGRSIEAACAIGNEAADECARRQVAEVLVDERNRDAIEQLEAELAAVTAERDALRGQHEATPPTVVGAKAVDAVAGAVRALQRALMLHMMELPVSITIELSPPAYSYLGRLAQEASPRITRWREFFLLDDFTRIGPVVVKPGDHLMPDVPDEKGDRR
jgi:hypothetical protein